MCMDSLQYDSASFIEGISDEVIIVAGLVVASLIGVIVLYYTSIQR